MRNAQGAAQDRRMVSRRSCRKPTYTALLLLAALLLFPGRSDGQSNADNLIAAAQEGRVRLTFTGRAQTYLQPLLNVEAEVVQGAGFTADLPVGQILRSQDPAYCDMVVQQLERPLDLQPNAPKTGSVFAYCLQVVPSQRNFPAGGVVYELAADPATPAIQNLLRSLSPRGRATWESYPAQLAVWAVTSDQLTQAGLEEYGGFRDLSLYWPEVATLLNEASIATPAQQEPSSAASVNEQPVNTVSDPNTQIGSGAPQAITPAAAGADVLPSPAAFPSANSPSTTGSQPTTDADWMLWLIVGSAVLVVGMMSVAVIVAARGSQGSESKTTSAPESDSTSYQPYGWNRSTNGSDTPPLPNDTRAYPPGAATKTVTSGTPSMTPRVPSEGQPEQKPNFNGRRSGDSSRTTVRGNNNNRPKSSSSAKRGAQPRSRGGAVDTDKLYGKSSSPTEIIKKQIVLRVLEPEDMKDVEYILPEDGGLLSREIIPFFILGNNEVSDPHALIRKDKALIYVRDLYSRNGTRINNTRIEPSKDRQLHDNDLVEFGNCRLIYREYNQSLTDQRTNQRFDLRNGGTRWLISRNQLSFAHHDQTYLSDKTVSIPHAKLEVHHGIYYLRDLCSSNKTFVKMDEEPEEEVSADERQSIADGAHIMLGRIKLEMKIEDPYLQEQEKVIINGRYRIVDLQAEGGMATIWIVKDKSEYDVQRALKMPSPKYMVQKGEAKEEILAAFKLEQEISEKLNHKNLVKVHAWGEDKKAGPYLVMDLVEGRSLRQILAKARTISAPLAAEIVCQIAEGLTALHQAGWVHCDVKPDNILINASENQAVLIDFGVAQKIGSTEIRRFGSMEYLPANYRSSTPATPAFDVYSLAVTLYEMLKGERRMAPDFSGGNYPGTTIAVNNYHKALNINTTMFGQTSREIAEKAIDLLRRVIEDEQSDVTLEEFKAVIDPLRSNDLHDLEAGTTR